MLRFTARTRNYITGLVQVECSAAEWLALLGEIFQHPGKYPSWCTKLASPKRVAPCMDDHQFAPEDFVTTGKLATIASKSVLKVLYLARVGRPDLLWTVNDLARNVTKWNVACDRRLHRLISYLEHTRQWVQTCFVGDPPEECKIVMYVDAGFAGDLTDSKSTSGAALFLVVPNTFFPTTRLCKKHGYWFKWL